MNLRLKCTLFCSPTTAALSSDLSPVWVVHVTPTATSAKAPKVIFTERQPQPQPNQVDIGARMDFCQSLTALRYVAQNRMCLSPLAVGPWGHRVYFKITSACGPESRNRLFATLASWTRAM